MDKLKFIGRGSALSHENNTSAYLIKHNYLVLFDIGGDIFKLALQKRVLTNPRVENIILFITHMHDDHVGSLVSLLEWVRYTKEGSNIKNVYIYSSFNALLDECIACLPECSRLESYLKIYDFEDWNGVKIIYPDKVKELLNIRVTPFYQAHTEKAAYSYLLEDLDDNTALYYSGDTSSHQSALSIITNPREMTHVDLYLECTMMEHSRVHFSYDRMIDLIKVIEGEALIKNLSYSINIMHIDNYDSYPDEIKSLIVDTI